MPWRAGCVNCACPVQTGGRGGDSPSLPDLSLQQDCNWYLDKCLLKQKADVSNMVDTTFLDYALKVLGKQGGPGCLAVIA